VCLKSLLTPPYLFLNEPSLKKGEEEAHRGFAAGSSDVTGRRGSREDAKGEVEERGKRSEERERMGEPEFSFSQSLRGLAAWREKKTTGPLLGERLTRRREDAKGKSGGGDSFDIDLIPR
jgi:hypothetical protein